MNMLFHCCKLLRTGFVLVLLPASILHVSVAETLNADDFRIVSQSSSDASGQHPAALAVDGQPGTYSRTDNVADAYWQGTLKRSRPLTRIELVNRTGGEHTEMGGQTLEVFDIDDQLVFSTVVTNPGSGGTQAVDLPPGTRGRIIRFGLKNGQSNAAGNFRSGLAEIRVTAEDDLFVPMAPTDLRAYGTAWQSSDYSANFPAANALDGNAQSFTHTANLPDSFWQLDLDQPREIPRIELVNRHNCCASRMGGLTLRIFDADTNSVASVAVSNPGLGGTFTYDPPVGTTGQFIRVGLENGQTNDDGNFYVTLAEVRLPIPAPTNTASNTWTNLALDKTSYMVRLRDSVSPASNGNDGDLGTEAETYRRTVDGYWEVDLGATYALYGVETIAASGPGDKIANTTLRLFDGAHDSIYSEPLSGGSGVYQNDVGGPMLTRYVRIGLENKQRTASGVEWWFGMKEVRVFGRPPQEVGLLSFTASANQVASGQAVTLNWAVEGVHRVELHPNVGSVGALTAPDGTGSIVLNPTNSTEYTLVAAGAGFTNILAVSVRVDAPTMPPVISEFVADNRYSLRDGHNDAPDWIELHNPGDVAIDLAGYGLSDDPLQPLKWTFPAATVLPPHGHLLVFASGRNDPVDPQGLGVHADFKLEKSGESVVLTAPDGVTTVDAILAYPRQDDDLAYGRDLDGNLTFIEPTPGAFNRARTYAGWLEPVAFSHSRGFYDAAFTLSLSNAPAGASIWFSTDGTEPSVPYATGLAISNTVSVRAQVTKPGYRSPQSKTHTYLFVDQVPTSAVMNQGIAQDPQYADRLRDGLRELPSISIVLPGTPDYPEAAGSMEVLWPDGSGHEQENCGVSRFGGAWTTFAKRNFRLKFREEYGATKFNAPLFDGFDRGVRAERSFDSLDLVGGGHDMVQRGFYMAGRFVEDSMLDMGSINPHGRYVHVYLNGVYWGQYHLRERLVDHFLADYLGGKPEEYVSVRGNDNIGNNFVLGTPEPPARFAWETLRANRNNYQVAKAYLDARHYIDFMILWFYGNCESEFRSAGPVAAGSGFKFWIADADGFLRTSANGLNGPGTTAPGFLFEGLTDEADPDFMTLLADRIYKHLHHDGALTPAQNAKRLAERMVEVQNSLIAECARWGYRTPANWESAEDNIQNNLFPNRSAELFTLLRNRGLYPAFDPPAFDQYGGIVTNGFQPSVTSPDGTIYYTLDGTDPRLPGGAVSPAALVWTPGAVTVTADTTFLARVRTAGGEWSACANPTFLAADRRPPMAGELLITEVHYNPDGSDEYEFIEFWNPGTNLLDLGGVRIDGGVGFTFPPFFSLPPGGFAVVVENTDLFAERYQDDASPWYWADIEVAGQWSGGLSNGGEALSLLASNGVELLQISYKTGGDWPERADGGGSSMSLRSPALAPATQPELNAFLAVGENWKSSSPYHGTPGRFDAFVTPVVIHEVLAHTDADTDWVELHNLTASPLSLAGYALTDHLDTPIRYVFPPTAVIPSNGFLSVTAAELGFGFSELGSDVALLEVSGAQILRFLDTVDFPATEREEPMGLYARSDGRSDFTELRATTRDASNALPRVGPVVISEIMYAPAAGKSQYLELSNISDAPVPLFDVDHPTNLWRVTGVGDYTFPTGTVLDACSPLILCATNPAVFRAQYGIDPAIPVFGPWSGRLDPDGEQVRLLGPGDPEPDGTVPYYRIDHVTYRTNAFWPAANQGDISLERFPLEAYGNDPAFWAASAPGGSPGAVRANRPPVLQVAGTNVVDEGVELVLQLIASDPDSPWQSLSVTQAVGPAGSSLDAETGSSAGARPRRMGPACIRFGFSQPTAPASRAWLRRSS